MEERNIQKKIIYKGIFLEDLVPFCKTSHKQMKTLDFISLNLKMTINLINIT